MLFDQHTVWVLIPIAAILAGVFRQALRLKEQRGAAGDERSAGLAARHAEHTERLEQRVRVLERIVTDKGHDVAIEIERLRDARAN